jgi:hypothetical protein
MVFTLKDHIDHYIIFTTQKTIIFAVYRTVENHICSVGFKTSASATNQQAMD